jgi:muramoyltetrapeptide carboxypeptidase
MKISHINVTMPRGSEDAARAFYGGLLGLKEIPKPEPLRARGGLDLHISVDDQPTEADKLRHFGLECADLVKLRDRLTAAGVATDDGRPAPWKRFFTRDPFGNRIEIHEPGGMRA